MRSHYIKMILSVWKAYSKLVFGTTCPVFGTFTNEGHLLPSPELAELASLPQSEEPDLQKYPPLNLRALAKDAKCSEALVQ